MNNVKPLKDANTEPDTDTVEALEEALELARKGELRSVYMVGQLTGLRTYTSYTSTDIAEGVSMLSFLLHRLNAKWASMVED